MLRAMETKEKSRGDVRPMSRKQQTFKHNVIALVYDFDGTLTPQPMQEYTVLPEIGITRGRDFWRAVRKEALATGGEEIVTYMRLMIEWSRHRHFPVTPRVLKSLARNIQYFPGVKGFFPRTNNHVRSHLDRDIELRHYVLSAGLKEIICGTRIARYFRSSHPSTTTMSMRKPSSPRSSSTTH